MAYPNAPMNHRSMVPGLTINWSVFNRAPFRAARLGAGAFIAAPFRGHALQGPTMQALRLLFRLGFDRVWFALAVIVSLLIAAQASEMMLYWLGVTPVH